MYQRTYSKTVLKNEEVPQKKRFPWSRVIIIASVVAVIVGMVFLIRGPQLQVGRVIVEGTEVADPDEVSMFVLDMLAGTYLSILPRSSIVLISPDRLESRIRETFPRFNNVEVKRSSVDSLNVRIAEYDGIYLWCDQDEACSFMDEKGTVFADAPYFSGSAYLKIYAGARESFPFTALTDVQLVLVRTVFDRLSSIGIDPIEFRFNADHELSVIFSHNGNRAYILFDPMIDVDTSLETLYTGLRTEPLAHLYHDSTSVLQYLDARFEGKLVYKFQ